jgi:hypothetical protein
MNRAQRRKSEQRQAMEGAACAWWLNCTNEAVTVEPHPILGKVPICARCRDKLRAIERGGAK